jgi:hypothetical protein
LPAQRFIGRRWKAPPGIADFAQAILQHARPRAPLLSVWRLHSSDAIQRAVELCLRYVSRDFPALLDRIRRTLKLAFPVCVNYIHQN